MPTEDLGYCDRCEYEFESTRQINHLPGGDNQYCDDCYQLEVEEMEELRLQPRPDAPDDNRRALEELPDGKAGGPPSIPQPRQNNLNHNEIRPHPPRRPDARAAHLAARLNDTEPAKTAHLSR